MSEPDGGPATPERGEALAGRRTAIGRTLIGVAVLGTLVLAGIVTSSLTGEPAGTSGRAALQLRPVLEVVERGAPGWDALAPTCTPEPEECTELAPAGEAVVEDARETRYRLAAPVVTEIDVTDARALSADGAWSVTVVLDGGAVPRFATVTGRLAASPPPRDRLAIVVDGILVSAPAVRERVDGGIVSIVGDFTEASATSLAARLSP